MTQVRRRSRSASQPLVTHVHMRRAYSDGRNGQLHLTTAYPSGGGFDERTPVVCLHPDAATGDWFRSLLPELGRDRSVYAPDLPAHGHSDPAPGTSIGMSDLVAAIGDFLDAMRLRSVDLVGHRLGAVIAAELAAQRPQQVRRIVLVALSDATRDSQRVAARLTAVGQQALLLHPADSPMSTRLPAPTLPQHSTVEVAQRSDVLYGTGAPDLARTLRGFLDR